MPPKVEIQFNANVTQFAAGVNKVRTELNNLVPPGVMSRLGGMMGAVFSVRGMKQILELADGIKTYSDRLSVSIKTVQQWQHAAAEADTSIQSFVTAFRTLVQVQNDVLSGRNPEALGAFEQMGISVEKLRSLSPEQLFLAVGDAVKHSGDSTEDLNAAFTVLGRGAMDLLPAMKRGLEELSDEAERLGLVMSDKVVTELANANDEIDRLKRRAAVQAVPVVAGAVRAMDMVGTAVKVAYHGAAALGTRNGFVAADEASGSWGALRDFLERNEIIDPQDLSGTTDPATKRELAARRQALGLPKQSTLSNSGEVYGPPTPPGWGNTISMAPNADALARIGLFRGSSGVESILRQQDDKLTQIRAELRELNNQIRSE